LREVNKKRLFSEIKFDRKDLNSGGAENAYMKGCLKMKRFYSMGGEKLWEEFGAKAESSELDLPSPATYESQKETFFSAKTRKMFRTILMLEVIRGSRPQMIMRVWGCHSMTTS
jgi:hypothetical protein